MSPPEVEIECPKAVALNVKFANGKTVLCGKGQRTKAILSGDEIGYVQASLEAERKNARKAGERDSDCDGGYIKILDEDYNATPVGSKKHRNQFPAEYDDSGAHIKTAKKPKADKK